LVEDRLWVYVSCPSRPPLCRDFQWTGAQVWTRGGRWGLPRGRATGQQDNACGSSSRNCYQRESLGRPVTTSPGPGLEQHYGLSQPSGLRQTIKIILSPSERLGHDGECAVSALRRPVTRAVDYIPFNNQIIPLILQCRKRAMEACPKSSPAESRRQRRILLRTHPTQSSILPPHPHIQPPASPTSLTTVPPHLPVHRCGFNRLSLITGLVIAYDYSIWLQLRGTGDDRTWLVLDSTRAPIGSVALSKDFGSRWAIVSEFAIRAKARAAA